MKLHRNAKLGLAGRFALVQARASGCSTREVARRFSVSPATVCRWHRRWREASEAERASLSCLFDRSSRPRRMPRLLPRPEQARICAARRSTGWGPRLLTVRVGHPHSTISKVLGRHGLSRPPRTPREQVRRYEWPCPGDFLHADWTLSARFQRPGHAVSGDRRSTAAAKKLRLRARDRRRPLPARLRGAPPRCQGADGDRLPRAGAHLPRQPRDPSSPADDGQPLQLHTQPLAAGTPRPARDPPSDDAEAAPAAEREGRALPPDDGQRVGLQRPLPLLSTPRPRPATPARPLQRTQTAQLPRRPTADQPRSQRL
jgi:leucine-zipper of insertion element IS481